MSAEVLIIGGGPAGLAVAIAAAQAGFAVEVAEPCTGAIDKCCGEGLLPPAVRALQQLGISLDALQGEASSLRGIAFHLGQRHTAASFAPGVPGLGLRRTVLHRLLMRRAQAVGVRVTPAAGKIVRMEQTTHAFVGDEERRPRWIVGADGAQSAVRGVSGLEAASVVSRRFALRQHFEAKSAEDRHRNEAGMRMVDVHWAQGAQAYVTPVGCGRIGVAIVSTSRFANMDAALGSFPALSESLRGAVSCSKPRGAITTHRTLRRVHRDGVALVGDASGSVDAVTGDGLSLAFQQALLLGSALRGGALEGYQQGHAALMRPARMMSRALLAMGATPGLTAASMLALTYVPGLFEGLLSLHSGDRGEARRTPAAKPDIPPGFLYAALHVPGTFQEEGTWQTVPTSTTSTM